MDNIKQKILIALVEGNFCKKVIAKIDHELALFMRKFLSQKSKIQNNKIMFMTFQNDYACNPKYIAEEIIRQNLPFDLVWVVKNEKKVKEHFPNNIRLVKRNSYNFYKEAMTAKVWIDNAINFFYEEVPKRKSQILINTWHGSMGLKRVGKDDNKNKKWVRMAERCDIDTDYCVSDSEFESEVYRETYWPTVEILNYGHPRNDIFIKTEKDFQQSVKEKVCKYFEIKTTCKIALYAPTFRDAHNVDCYDLDYDMLHDSLIKRFGGEWVILVRHHFKLQNSKSATESIKNANVLRATDYDDMQELMLVADIGITDYSSWICDFVLTGKPGFIFATDLEEYNNERGLYYPLEETPFPIAKNNERMEENILNFDDNKYEKMRLDFLEKRGCWENGDAALKTVEKIKDIIGVK